MRSLQFLTPPAAILLLAAALPAQTLATGDTRTVHQPRYPMICQILTAQFSSSQRSSPPSSDDTTRIQAALNSCAGSGHSVLLAASGTNDAFYSNLLTVNGEGLIIGDGATLYGNDSYAAGKELVLVEGANSFIGGPGTIDGRGDIVSGTPRLVQTTNTTNLIVYNVTLAQARHPNLYMEGGDGATVYRVKIRTPANRANADGIDIDSITNVTVDDCSINAGDDGIAVKTNSGPASNITVKHTKIFGTHGLSIGSQTMYGVTNVLFNHNFVFGVDLNGIASTDANAINIKSDVDCGGPVTQVTYSDTCITQSKHLIVLNTEYGSCSGITGIPMYSDIVIDGVRSTNSVAGAYSRILGYDSNNPINAFIANISLDSNAQSGDQDAIVDLDNVNGFLPSGTNVTTGSFTLRGRVPSCEPDE